MKIREPFAGYQLTKANLGYHLSFFCASWVVNVKVNTLEDSYMDLLLDAFVYLRWTHFILCISEGIIQLRHLKSLTALIKTKKDSKEQAQHKADVVSLWSKCIEVINMVIFTCVIILAQYRLGNYQLHAPQDVRQSLEFIQIECWIIIELCCFYGMIVAAFFYIITDQVKYMLWPNAPKEEQRKNMDFLRYAQQKNLNWFISMFLLVFIPIPLIVFQEESCYRGFNEPYFVIMVVLATSHFIFWAVLGRIYILVPKPKEEIQIQERLDNSNRTINDYSNAINAEDDDPVNQIQQISTVEENSDSDDQDKNNVIYESKFTLRRWWVWIPAILLEVALFISYFHFTSEKILYVLYIPLNFCFLITMFLQYLNEYLVDKAKNQVKNKSKNRLSQRNSSFNLHERMESIAERHQKAIENAEAQKKAAAEFKLSSDSYAMAYKALNRGVQQEINLTATDYNNAYFAACTVFSIQMLLVIFVSTTMGEILFPNNVQTLGARLLVSILMHLQVEGDVRQGISMMKYTINHKKDFDFPIIAFTVGTMQFIGGITTEILCILYIATQNTTIPTIIKFIALGSIANVDNFYAGALPYNYPLKQKSDPLPVKVHRGDPEARDRSCCLSGLRFFYKFIRLFYCSGIFYFLPYLAVFTSYLNPFQYGTWPKCYNPS